MTRMIARRPLNSSLVVLLSLALGACGSEAPNTSTGDASTLPPVPCRTNPLPSRWPRVMCDRGASFEASQRWGTVEMCSSDLGRTPTATPQRDPVSTHPQASACAGWLIITAQDALAVYR